MKRKTSEKTPNMPRTSILDIHIRIWIRRHRRAKVGLDPSGHDPSFQLTLQQVLEGSRNLAKERLGRKREPTWNQLLCDLKAFGESFKTLPKDGKIEMLTVGSGGNGSLRRIRPSEIGLLGFKAGRNLVHKLSKQRKPRLA